MKILICIPHFFAAKPAEEARYGSESDRRRQTKQRSLARSICNLHLLFGHAHIGANHALRIFEQVPNECADFLQIRIVTVAEKHLLGELGISPRLYEHIMTDANPRHLGFEAHKVIQEQSGQFDYYGYLEDDILIHDPHFFRKLDYFNRAISIADPNFLLQPNRFEYFFSNENVHSAWVHKIYPDYTYVEGPNSNQVYTMDYLGEKLEFEKSRAPHSGCFFVNNNQLAKLGMAKNFGSAKGIDEDMVLDAAATTPIFQMFTIFKSTKRNMNFLQIEHAVPNFFDQMEIKEDGSIIWNHPWNDL